MDDEKIKKELKKCSRCGLCLKQCPIYEIKKDENNTSRGLICKLLGFENNILNKNEISKDLKICLNCTKCRQNCPSRVNSTNIFAYKNACFSPSKISQRLLLLLKLLPVKMLYFLNLFKSYKVKNKSLKYSYFKGCMAHAQHKVTFLDNLSNENNFLCCGLPYLTSGDLKNYNKVKEINSKLIKNSNFVLFDCASCISSVRDYDTLSEDDKKKLILFSDLIDGDIEIKLNNNSKYKTLTFHKPCHLNESEFLKIENLLKKIKNIKYVRMDECDSCCGFGGSYFLYHPIIATKIALKKAKNIKKTKADLVLTMCPSCTLGLRYNQIVSFGFKKTLELRDFLEKETNFNPYN